MTLASDGESYAGPEGSLGENRCIQGIHSVMPRSLCTVISLAHHTSLSCAESVRLGNNLALDRHNAAQLMHSTCDFLFFQRLVLTIIYPEA